MIGYVLLMADTPETICSSENILNREKIKLKVHGYITRHQYHTALFWAEILVSLSHEDHADLFWYAQTMFLTGQYHRAAHLIKSKQLDKKFLCARYLAAKCHYEAKEWMEALAILDQGPINLYVSLDLERNALQTDMPSENIESAVNLLRGEIYEALDNRNLAVECFTEALKLDVYCYEAFDRLTNHHMMTSQEEVRLLELLPFASQCEDGEEQVLRFIYEDRLKKYNKPSTVTVPACLDALKDNREVLVSRAERHYYNCHFKRCYNLSSRILKEDAYNNRCLPIHIAVLVELKMKNELFYLAHKLVDLYPNKAVAWFAVGCYYLLVGKYDPARRYLSKATALDRLYGPAWLAFGHSFATENEHDQAMAAYFTAAQLMKGCHLPVLYIGLEYGLTHNLKLASRFFSQALSIAPHDPFVLHEIGVVAFHNRDYGEAEMKFRGALSGVQEVSDDVIAEEWEPLLNNLGNVYRKLRNYPLSLKFHGEALLLCPHNPSTLAAIGYVHALMGELSLAVEYFHKALGLRKDDTFSTTMMSYAVEELMSAVNCLSGTLPESVPVFTYSGRLNRKSVKPDWLTSPGVPLNMADCSINMADVSTNMADVSTNMADVPTNMADVSTNMADSSAMAIDTDPDDTS